MKEAIEILEKYYETCKEYRASPETLRHVNMCISVLQDKMDIQYTWKSFPDTPYKAALTKWVKDKENKRMSLEFLYKELQKPGHVKAIPQHPLDPESRQMRDLRLSLDERERKIQVDLGPRTTEVSKKAFDDALITGRGVLSYGLDANGEVEVKHVDILEHEEGEG